MKKIGLAILLFCAAASASVFAQTLSFQLGDVELEATLNDFNAQAKVDMGGAAAEITLEWGVPQKEVQVALTQGLQPAEVYVAASFAQASKQPLDKVIVVYKKNPKAGWGAVAKALGIKPGSEAFKALKAKSKVSVAKKKNEKKK